MHFIYELSTDSWIAPPQEDFPRPTWTRLFADGRMISNALEAVDLSANIAMPFACEQCWDPQCSGLGFSHIRRFGRYVVWYELSARDCEVADLTWNTSNRPVTNVIPIAEWDRIATRACLPLSSSISSPTRQDIKLWWERATPRSYPQRSISEWLVETSESSCVCSHPDAVELGQAVVMRWLQWLDEAPAAEVVGHFEVLESTEELQLFVFDLDQTAEWNPYVAGSRRIALGNRVAIVLDSVP